MLSYQTKQGLYAICSHLHLTSNTARRVDQGRTCSKIVAVCATGGPCWVDICVELDMGKAKKTRKFAEVKRMMSLKDVKP